MDATSRWKEVSGEMEGRGLWEPQGTGRDEEQRDTGTGRGNRESSGPGEGRYAGNAEHSDREGRGGGRARS
jgi:hypothetical protein